MPSTMTDGSKKSMSNRVKVRRVNTDIKVVRTCHSTDQIRPRVHDKKVDPEI